MLQPNNEEELLLQDLGDKLSEFLRLRRWEVMRGKLSEDEVRFMDNQEELLQCWLEELRVQFGDDRGLELLLYFNRRWERAGQATRELAAIVSDMRDDDECKDRQQFRDWIMDKIEPHLLNLERGCEEIVPQIREVVCFRLQMLPWDLSAQDEKKVHNEAEQRWHDAVAEYGESWAFP